MRLPERVEDPTLVGVRGALVWSAGDDGGGVRSVLVGHVVDCEGILVVAVADVPSEVLRIGSSVDNALCVMDIAILRSAARSSGLRWIRHIDEDKATSTSSGTRSSADGNGVVLLLVNDNVV